MDQASDGNTGVDADSSIDCCCRVGHRHRLGFDPPVSWHQHDPTVVGRGQQGNHLPGFVRGDDSGVVTDLGRDFQPTFEILVVFLGECDPEAAILVEIDRVPGLLFEVFEELDVVESEVGGEPVAVEIPGLAGGHRSGAGSHRSAIDQHDIFDSGLGQVKCGTGSQHTASNDDDFGRGRKHSGSLREL